MTAPDHTGNGYFNDADYFNEAETLADLFSDILNHMEELGIASIPDPPKRGSATYREIIHELAHSTDIPRLVVSLQRLWAVYGWRALTDYLLHLCVLLHRHTPDEERTPDGVVTLESWLVTRTRTPHLLRMATTFSSEPEARLDFGDTMRAAEEMIEGNLPWYDAVHRALAHLRQADDACREAAAAHLLAGIAADRVIDNRLVRIRSEHERLAWAELGRAPEARTSFVRAARVITPIHLTVMGLLNPDELDDKLRSAGVPRPRGTE